MPYYAANDSPGWPPSILCFETELDRDEFTSRKPSERRAADPPADTTGFRHSELHEPAARVLYFKIRAMTPEEIVSLD